MFLGSPLPCYPSKITLGLPAHRRQDPTLGRSDLSPRIFLDTHLNWICWLTQVMDLIWWVTMNPSLSPFLYTCLSPFLSTKWFLIVTRTLTSSWVWSWSSNLSTKCVQSTLHNQMTLYSLLVMLLDHFKTKFRYLKHL